MANASHKGSSNKNSTAEMNVDMDQIPTEGYEHGDLDEELVNPEATERPAEDESNSAQTE
ncbi:MAG TPA: hypothetical protein V6D10_15680 [Trichocoleus sp.]